MWQPEGAPARVVEPLEWSRSIGRFNRSGADFNASPYIRHARLHMAGLCSLFRAQPTPKTRNSRVRGKMKKILLVDDHAPTRLVISLVLAESGQKYHIIQASSGEEACARAISEQPDLMLLDVCMPGLDGYETLVKLRESPETQALKVMMLTAQDMPFQRKLAFDYGADGYLVKPIRQDELRRSVRYALATGRHRRPLLPRRVFSNAAAGIS